MQVSGEVQLGPPPDAVTVPPQIELQTVAPLLGSSIQVEVESQRLLELPVRYAAQPVAPAARVPLAWQIPRVIEGSVNGRQTPSLVAALSQGA